MNVMTISARIAEIAGLAIEDLAQRQPMLVSLIADIVNHETEDGYLTTKAGNRALTAMEYWPSLMVYLKDAGFELLGNGHFSAAFKHKLLPMKVIKVGFKKEDSGAAYAAFCRMHQGKQGIPTIHDIQRHKSCYTVVLDELRPLDTSRWGDVLDTEDAADQFDIARDVISYNSSEHDERILSDRDVRLLETCKEIRKFFDGIASFDMHSGNAMVDSVGNLVITDPVSFTASEVDNNREDFMIDPEELLKEIEGLAQQRMIERCVERKLKRDPNGPWRIELKKRRQNRKQWKRMEKNMERINAARKLDHHNAVRDEYQARLVMGSDQWQRVWLRMGNAAFHKLEQIKAQQFRNKEHKAIAMGGALAIDKILDSWFQG